MKHKKLSFTLLVFLFFCVPVFSQVDSNSDSDSDTTRIAEKSRSGTQSLFWDRYPEVTPPSPTAANLAKFVEVPVSLHTGTPQISIPLFTIQEGDYTLPITLDYNAHGIKVSEIASWVGLGWSLSAGGVITRQTNGLHDEASISRKGFINSDKVIVAQGDSGYYNDLRLYGNGEKDNQPDVFYYNFAGHSGRFIFSELGEICTIPQNNMKIKGTSRMFDSNSLHEIDTYFHTWEITTEDGVKYTFSDYEQSDVIAKTISDRPWNTGISSVVNSWFLSKIELPEGGTITFSYDNTGNYHNLTYDVYEGQNVYYYLEGGFHDPNYSSNPPLIRPIAWTRMRTWSKRLNQISFSNGNVFFVRHSKERADLRGDYALQKVQLKNNNEDIIKQYALSYDILDGTTTAGNTLTSYENITVSGENYVEYTPANGVSAPLKRRLMLRGVKELNASGAAENNGYRFDYFTNKGLPHRFYPRTDHWGYANAAAVLEPFKLDGIIIHAGLVNGLDTYKLDLAKKVPNLEYSKQGTLYKITHPTIGTTTLEYELHDYAGLVKIDGYYPPTHLAGGLRIKQKRIDDPVTGNSIIKKYNYTTGPISTGKLMDVPRYSRNYYESLSAEFKHYWLISLSSFYPLSSTNGSYVCYDRVTEESVDVNNNPLGKTEYEFTRYTDIGVDIGVGPEIIEGHHFPYPPLDKRDWCNGKLIKKIDYLWQDNTYKEVARIENTWTTSFESIATGYKVGISCRSVIDENHLFQPAIYPVSGGMIRLTSSNEKTDSVSIRTTNNYQIDKPLPYHISTSRSDGFTQHQYISYPYDYTSSGFVSSLLTKNILKPIEEVIMVEKSGTKYITQGVIQEYNSDGTISKIKQLETTSAIAQNQFKFSSRSTGVLLGSGSKAAYSADSRYKDKTTFTYYNGRIASYKVDEVTTAFLWGYKNQYPVAKVVGSPITNLRTLLTSTDLTTINSGTDDDKIKTALNKIRTNYSTSIPQVSTYTYFPLIGTRSETNPVGILSEYEYDSFNRLYKVKYDNKTIEEYNYNYKTQ